MQQKLPSTSSESEDEDSIPRGPPVLKVGRHPRQPVSPPPWRWRSESDNEEDYGYGYGDCDDESVSVAATTLRKIGPDSVKVGRYAVRGKRRAALREEGWNKLQLRRGRREDPYA